MRHKKIFIIGIAVFLAFCIFNSASAAGKWVKAGYYYYVNPGVPASKWTAPEDGYLTQNYFVYKTFNPRLAETIGEEMERQRNEISKKYIGGGWDEKTGKVKPGTCMANWYFPARVKVNIGELKGETRFNVRGSQNGMLVAGDWLIILSGSEDFIFKNILPHEVMHSIISSYFVTPAPLPIGINEGLARSVEDERIRNMATAVVLYRLKTGKGIAFNDLFNNSKYPEDANESSFYYAQGYSVVDFLTQETCGGKQKLVVEFFQTALILMGIKDKNGKYVYSQDGAWSESLRRTYKDKDGKPLFNDLGDLQNKWLAWVAKGSPRLTSPAAKETKDAGAMVQAPRQCLPPSKMPSSLCPSNPIAVAPAKDAGQMPALVPPANMPKDKNCELPPPVEVKMKEQEKPTLWLIKIGGPNCMYCVILEKNIDQVLAMINSGQLKLNINVKLKKLDVSNSSERPFADRFAGMSGSYPIPVLVYLDGNANYVGGQGNAVKSGNRSVDQLIAEIRQAEATLTK